MSEQLEALRERHVNLSAWLQDLEQRVGDDPAQRPLIEQTRRLLGSVQGLLDFAEKVERRMARMDDMARVLLENTELQERFNGG